MSILEEEFKKLAPAAKKCMILTTTLSSLGMIIVVLAAYFIIDKYVFEFQSWVITLIIAWVALWLIFMIVAPIIRYRRYRYMINDEKVVVKEGLIFVTQEFAPIERMHQITVKSGPIDRLFGLANVIATTAGGTIAIRFLEATVAEEIADTLQSKVRYLLQKQGISLAEQSIDADVAKEPGDD